VVSKVALPGKAINVHLVETSPAMRALQQAKLERSNIEIHWHNSINEIAFSPSEYTMLVAHEFFDALPIHILQVRTISIYKLLCDLLKSRPLA
jgi:NADH dehydrogenase [ubiquinone] 1 alpha subcomplex assembly factor 7